MKHILISGADGFIGKNLIKVLPSSDFQIHSFTGDITKADQVDSFISSLPDLNCVFHFAGISSPTVCLQDKDLAIAVNVDGAKNFAGAISRSFPSATFVFPSTGQVYASDSLEPLSESAMVKPSSFYAETKFQAEQELVRIKNLKLVVLRLFNHTHKSQDPIFFLPSLYRQIQAGAEAIKTGNLELVRDFGAIQDLLSALKILASGNSGAGLFNLCSGTGKKLKNLANELALQLNKRVQWEQDPALFRKGEPVSIVGSSLKFQEKFSWKPQNALDEKVLIKSFLT
jgi:GDP-4-dehydro-6-deoxy-D-mannose reductase